MLRILLVLACGKYPYYYVDMFDAREGDNSPESVWFENVELIYDATKRHEELDKRLAAKALMKLPFFLRATGFKGELLDSDTIKALFEIMPAIQDRLSQPPEEDESQLVILSPGELKSRSFLNALTIASRAADRPLRGNCDGVTVTARPNVTEEELVETHRIKWVGSPRLGE